MRKWTTILTACALAACATAPAPPMHAEPRLATLAASYADALRSVGITRILSPGNGALVRLDTFYNAVYIRYPAGMAPRAFELDVADDGLKAAAAEPFDDAAYRRLFDVLVPDAVRETSANNAFEWMRANPVD